MSTVAYTSTASEKSLALFERVWSERTDAPFETEKFKGRTQEQLSALINRALPRPALPPTEAQLDEIAQLCAQVELVSTQTGEITHPSYVTADRAVANKQLTDLRKRVRSQNFAAAKAQADTELDELFSASSDLF